MLGYGGYFARITIFSNIGIIYAKDYFMAPKFVTNQGYSELIIFLYLYRINQSLNTMILISFSIALIAIVFGAKLLAQSQKDNLGALYKYLAWFIMVMGFLVLLCDGARGFLGMCHRGEARMMNKECMMRGDDGMMGGDCQMMMRCHRGYMCHEDGCNGGMMNCKDGAGCPMHDGCNGMMNCKDDGKGTGCPAMGNGMKCKMDSAKAKK